MVKQKMMEAGADPAFAEKFDKVANLPKEQLSKLIGAENVEKLESAVKTLTDPFYGWQGGVGKTIVDIVKGVPTSIDSALNGDDE